jgi:hypothetical protein
MSVTSAFEEVQNELTAISDTLEVLTRRLEPVLGGQLTLTVADERPIQSEASDIANRLTGVANQLQHFRGEIHAVIDGLDI